MELRYMDGSIGFDSLFDRPDKDQIAAVRRDLGMHPDDAGGLSMISQLLSVRRYEGMNAYHRKIHQMMTPPPKRAD